jgi:hypothetical protein
MNKYLKYGIVYLYCIYFVCSFLPAKFIFPGGFEILGSEFLFAILNGTPFAKGWQISILGIIGILTGLFATLFFSKKITTLYINIGINMTFSVLSIFSLIFGIANGSGVEVCLVISAIILIVNIFLILGFKPQIKKKKHTVYTKSANRTSLAKTKATSSAPKVNNSFGARYCKYCGKLLFSNEICDCRSYMRSTSNPVKISKCAYCGRTLFGSEKCTCAKK